jgi:hypothetical protein
MLKSRAKHPPYLMTIIQFQPLKHQDNQFQRRAVVRINPLRQGALFSLILWIDNILRQLRRQGVV